MGHNFMSCHYVFLVEYILIHFWSNCYEYLLRTFALPDKLSYGGFSNSHWKMVVWLFFSCQLRSDSQNWDFYRFQIWGSFSWLSTWWKQTKKNRQPFFNVNLKTHHMTICLAKQKSSADVHNNSTRSVWRYILPQKHNGSS